MVGEGLIAIIERVITISWSWVYLLLPLKMIVVREGEHGVRYTWGVPRKQMGPGLHAATLGQSLSRGHTRLLKNDIDEIELNLSDRVPVRVNGCLVYTIVDLGQYQTVHPDTHWMITEFAGAAVLQTLSGLDYKTFHDDIHAAEIKICEITQELSSDNKLGAKVLYFRFSSFEVTLESARNALAIDTLIAAIGEIPEEQAMSAGFGGKVAMIIGALSSNILSSPPTLADSEDFHSEE